MFFKTNDGFTYDEKGLNLGRWIHIQRVRFLNLSQERQQLLQSIGFILNLREKNWQKNYELAKNYYEKYGNLEIPQNFKTSDGFAYDENGIKLGVWISNQRASFLDLSQEQQQLLQSIGFILNLRDKNWQKNYQLAKNYYEKHGNLEIPVYFKTNDGFTYDEKGLNLGRWIHIQRVRFLNLSQERQQLLQSIGFILNPREKNWQKNYQLAKNYYEKHGSLKIPFNFKTNDGFTYDEKGLNLGHWIHNQRVYVNPESEKGKLLLSIGMRWNVTQNKEKVANICKTYNINQIKNKSILNHISIQELQSKIEFLNSNNIPIVDENGLLMDIFSMSSSDMKEKYGISLEELISEYYIKNQKGKGV